ncbi:MAG TPA: tol-pal system protein YbgF [Gemmatimonadaceae bacterium]|nr:tol-pal system protein YbgF [Gemmatimonadaceae bacterium]
MTASPISAPRPPKTQTIRRRLARRLLAPAALVAAAGCVATRNDIRLLQNDLRVMRAEAAIADTARRRDLEQLERVLGTLQDSMRLVTARMAKSQGDVREDLYGLQQQLVQIQELTGQSQRRLQELRAEMEQRSRELQAASTGAPDSAGAPAGAAGAAGATPPQPGPNQLFQLALDQLRRGSTGAARTGMQELLRLYPTSDVAAEAQFYIGESYAAEGKTAQADSAYAAVAQRYPESSRAPTALYKYALSLEKGGRKREARQVLDDVVRKYPRSDEAVLARDRLRTLR